MEKDTQTAAVSILPWEILQAVEWAVRIVVMEKRNAITAKELERNQDPTKDKSLM